MAKVVGRTDLTPEANVYLPTIVVEQLLAFQEGKLSGWIQLNFNGGELQSWQSHEHHRLTE